MQYKTQVRVSLLQANFYKIKQYMNVSFQKLAALMFSKQFRPSTRTLSRKERKTLSRYQSLRGQHVAASCGFNQSVLLPAQSNPLPITTPWLMLYLLQLVSKIPLREGRAGAAQFRSFSPPFSYSINASIILTFSVAGKVQVLICGEHRALLYDVRNRIILEMSFILG